jgi:hypothetical protein
METKSLADAMRTRARWLREKGSNSFLESGWGNSASVQSALLEMADVIDSWSGEYLSKEETERENLHRELGMHGYKPDTPAMTQEERIAAAQRNKRTYNQL